MPKRTPIIESYASLIERQKRLLEKKKQDLEKGIESWKREIEFRDKELEKKMVELKQIRDELENREIEYRLKESQVMYEDVQEIYKNEDIDYGLHVRVFNHPEILREQSSDEDGSLLFYDFDFAKAWLDRQKIKYWKCFTSYLLIENKLKK